MLCIASPCARCSCRPCMLPVTYDAAQPMTDAMWVSLSSAVPFYLLLHRSTAAATTTASPPSSSSFVARAVAPTPHLGTVDRAAFAEGVGPRATITLVVLLDSCGLLDLLPRPLISGQLCAALLTWLRKSSRSPPMRTMMVSHSKACRHPARSAASDGFLLVLREPTKMLDASSKGVPVIQHFSIWSRKNDVNTRPPGPSS